MDLSIIGIISSLVVIVTLALRGVGIMLIGAACSCYCRPFLGMGVLDTLIGPYMKGFVNYAGKFYLIFLFRFRFWKYMDDSGAAKAVAGRIMQVIGHEKTDQRSICNRRHNYFANVRWSKFICGNFCGYADSTTVI